MAAPNEDHTAINSPTASLTQTVSNEHEMAAIQNPKAEQSAPPVTSANQEDDPNDPRYYHGTKLFLSQVAMLLSVFLIALDQTITSTAIPRIASEFNSLNDVTWIAACYFITQAGFLMLYGQLLVIASTKWVYIAAVTLFEIGSLICGVAPNVNVLIFGRAFAGVGAAGIMVSVQSIIAQIARIKDRPLLFGSFSAVFALASVVGPLLGGAFSDHVTWRWCFYINLPIGGLSVGVILLLIDARPPIGSDATDGMTTLQRWINLDWLGALLSVGFVTTLVLPLEWGGNSKAWNDPAVIATFCVFGVLLILFILWEWRMGPRALMPLHMFKRRTQVGACLEAFFVMLCMLLATYYLPLLYQAKGHSATQSGIDILPFMLSTVVSAAGAAAIINYTGRYWFFLVGLPLITAVGAGLLFTIDAYTPNAKLIGFQILYGAGLGGAMQNTVIAVQAEYNSEERLVPQGTSMVNFTQLIGGTIGISIAGTAFSNELSKQVLVYAPGLPAATVQAIKDSVTAVLSLPASQQAGVVEAYTKALDYVYLIGVPAGVLASLSALMIRNMNIKRLGMKTTAAAV